MRQQATEPDAVSPQSLWNVMRKTAENWYSLNAPRLDAALAYYTMLSLAPLLFISVSVAGLVQIFCLGTAFTHSFAERHGSRARARLEQEPAAEAPGPDFRRPRLA